MWRNIDQVTGPSKLPLRYFAIRSATGARAGVTEKYAAHLLSEKRLCVSRGANVAMLPCLS